MNREIKFRGKDIDCNEWRYGSLVKVRENDGYLLYYIVDEENQQWIALPETVGQYTGLKDKNGKDIYEGDICKSVDGIFEICWNDERCAFEMWFYYDNETLYLEEMWKDTEIIGNIHDNPELLEVENE